MHADRAHAERDRAALPSAAAPRPERPARRLRPDAASRLAALRGKPRIDALYEKPVHELSPAELAAMRAAFLRDSASGA